MRDLPYITVMRFCWQISLELLNLRLSRPPCVSHGFNCIPFLGFPFEGSREDGAEAQEEGSLQHIPFVSRNVIRGWFGWRNPRIWQEWAAAISHRAQRDHNRKVTKKNISHAKGWRLLWFVSVQTCKQVAVLWIYSDLRSEWDPWVWKKSKRGNYVETSMWRQNGVTMRGCTAPG